MAFPTTGLLDDFNRADTTSGLGTNWSSPFEPSFGFLGILSNEAYSDATFDDAYWTTSFDANQEVYVTLPVVTTSAQPYVLARIQNPNSASRNAYRLVTAADGSGWIEKVVSGTVTALGGGWGAGSVVAGNKVGLECNGTTITAYKYSGGSWSVLEQLTSESSVSGAGSIGLSIRGETVSRFDDFSGGAIVSDAAPTLRTVQAPYRWG